MAVEQGKPLSPRPRPPRPCSPGAAPAGQGAVQAVVARRARASYPFSPRNRVCGPGPGCQDPHGAWAQISGAASRDRHLGLSLCLGVLTPAAGTAVPQARELEREAPRSVQRKVGSKQCPPLGPYTTNTVGLASTIRPALSTQHPAQVLSTCCAPGLSWVWGTPRCV